MSKYFAVASFVISLLALGISIVCSVDPKDDLECSIVYNPTFSVNEEPV